MADSSRGRERKRLLVAAIGVATVTYASTGCSRDHSPPASGNLLVPPAADAGTAAMDAGADAIVGSGNLLTPPPADAGPDAIVGSGNLLPPPPVDAGIDAASGDAGPDAAIGDAGEH